MGQVSETLGNHMAKERVERDPGELGLKINQMREEQDPESKLLLGLDLATSTGYCFTFGLANRFLRPLPSWMGQLDLSLGSFDSGISRPVKLMAFLDKMKPAAVGFEGRDFSMASMSKFDRTGMKASEVSASLRTAVGIWCSEHDVPCYGIPIGTIKKRATGKGNASKVDMIEACNREFGTSFDTSDYNSTGVDNIADAAFVTALVASDLCGGLMPAAELDTLLYTLGENLKSV